MYFSDSSVYMKDFVYSTNVKCFYGKYDLNFRGVKTEEQNWRQTLVIIVHNYLLLPMYASLSSSTQYMTESLVPKKYMPSNICNELV